MLMMNRFNDMLTIISFCGNLVVVVCFLRNLYEYILKKRYIKKVLGYDREAVQISHCTFLLETYSGSQNKFVTYSSVIAMNNIINLFNKVSQKFYLVENPIDSKNEMNIGGFSANKKVNAYFTKYFPNFRYVDSERKREVFEKQPINKNIFEFSLEDKRGFKIDDENFFDTTEKIVDYAFLVKLIKSDFKNDNEKTVHIVFGGTDIGTIKATEFLMSHYKQIYEKFGEEHYFFALEINRIDNSINFSKGIIDLTDRMFQQKDRI